MSLTVRHRLASVNDYQPRGQVVLYHAGVRTQILNNTNFKSFSTRPDYLSDMSNFLHTSLRSKILSLVINSLVSNHGFGLDNCGLLSTKYLCPNRR